MRDRGTRDGPIIPYVPEATPEASLDPLLTDYIRRELEKIQDTLAAVVPDVALLRTRGGRRNFLMNGNFDIWQRGTPSGGGAFGADRWFFGRAGGSATFAKTDFAVGQTYVPSASRSHLRVTFTGGTGASDYVYFHQRIEDARITAGRQLTLSFYARSIGAPLNMAVGALQVSGGTGLAASPVKKFALSTNWQKCTHTFNTPSLSGQTLTDPTSLQVEFWLSAGSTFNARTDSLGVQSGTIDITSVQIEEGGVATDFERLSIAEELANCMRYYQVGGQQIYGYVSNPTVILRYDRLGINMRATPAVAVQATYYGNTQNAIVSGSPNSIRMSVDVIAAGFGNAVVFWAADAEL